MSFQEKTLNLSADRQLRIKEQVIYDPGEEGLCIWESGIVMGRHFAVQAPESVAG